MAEGISEVGRVFSRSPATAEMNVSQMVSTGATPTKVLSAARILFGAVFLFDGILKWILFQQGTMQGVIQGYGYDYLSNNWVAVGVLVGVGETLGGLALILGLFQRPAAIWSAGIMFTIWGFGGFGGVYTPGSPPSFAGYTDPGGDLMLALVYLVLVFAPYAYGLASRYHLRNRWPGNTFGTRLKRFLVA